MSRGAVAANVTSTQSISPREARRLHRIEMSREQILNTAEALFAEHGYHATSLKQVAASCEFSVGSIYSFFESKEKLFEDVLMRRTRLQGDEVRRFAPESMAGDERLVEIARVQIAHMRAYPAWNVIAVDTERITQIQGGVMPTAYRNYLHRSIAFIRGVVEQGQRDGTVRAGDSETLAQLYYTILTSYISGSAVLGSAGGDGPDVDLYLDFLRKAFSARS